MLAGAQSVQSAAPGGCSEGPRRDGRAEPGPGQGPTWQNLTTSSELRDPPAPPGALQTPSRAALWSGDGRDPLLSRGRTVHGTATLRVTQQPLPRGQPARAAREPRPDVSGVGGQVLQEEGPGPGKEGRPGSPARTGAGRPRVRELGAEGGGPRGGEGIRRHDGERKTRQLCLGRVCSSRCRAGRQ